MGLIALFNADVIAAIGIANEMSQNLNAMKRNLPKLACVAAITCLLPAQVWTAERKLDYAVSPVPFQNVHITDAFWTPRLENNRAVTIPRLFDRYEQGGRGADLRLIEAACYVLAQHPDSALRSRVDSKLDQLISRIRSRKGIWFTAGDGEGLYAANFLETSVAYYEATGSRKLIDVAIENLLGGIGTISGKALVGRGQDARIILTVPPLSVRGDSTLTMDRGKDGTSVWTLQQNFTAIPYYALANRSPGEMSVWLARDEAKAKIAPKPSIASTSRATSSCGHGTVAENYPGHAPPTIARRFYPGSQDGSGDISAICDQVEPVNSEDGSSPFLRLHPQSGDRAWVQYDFTKPEKVSSVEIYWKDDKQYCVLPKSWRLLCHDGNNWKPVAASGPYTVAKDKFNKAAFRPVTTSGLRVEIELQAKLYKPGSLGPPDADYLTQDLSWFEGGVIEWRVNP